MPRPLIASIDLQALAHNFDLVRRLAPQARIWAVVKSNGYGHGLTRVARALRQADGLAVVDIGDAVRLRELGIRKPILLMQGVNDPAEIRACAEDSLHTVIHSIEQVRMIESLLRRRPLDVYLKMNSGMNRLGFPPSQIIDIYRRITARLTLNSISLMTHFADADGATGVDEPLAQFLEACNYLQGERCAANSAAIFRYPQTHLDWVRPGIALYGSSPFADQSASELGLLPVMTLSSAVIAVQEVPRGGRVGYGGTYVAPRDMRVGVIACGYADGYPRHATEGTPVLVGGLRAPLIGRVSMEMITVDLSRLPEARVGSEAVLWGDGLSVDEVARCAGTVGYELLTGVSARVPVEERRGAEDQR
jgi:alanine racemase